MAVKCVYVFILVIAVVAVHRSLYGRKDGKVWSVIEGDTTMGPSDRRVPPSTNHNAKPSYPLFWLDAVRQSSQASAPEPRSVGYLYQRGSA